jgi:TolB-like protein/cytochrome c-type biogenesis protein CcmH/NrfG
LSIDHSAPRGAVFLSYASQDAEAAKRIAHALRAAGVEVWFDQSELVGGDAWDQKIRRQIKECALLIPVISENTQARTEGYFRLEWRLADQRTHLMAKGRAFLLPVVIDGTPDAEAAVPDSFLDVQWTRLRPASVGEANPPAAEDPGLGKFVMRVKDLLSADPTARTKVPRFKGQWSSNPMPEAVARASGQRRWLAFGAVAVFALAATVCWVALRSSSGSRSPAPADAPARLSEAQQLVAKAWSQLNKAELARGELELADAYGRRATELEPNNADAWAAWSQVDSWYVYHDLDDTSTRRENARLKAARALQLAPNSYEARLAQACYLVRSLGGRGGTTSLFDEEAKAIFAALLRERPAEPRALLALGILQRNTGQAAEARATFEKLAANPDFAALAWNEIAWAAFIRGDNRAAEAAVDRSVALQPCWPNLLLKVILAELWTGDLGEARAMMDKIPIAVRQEDHAVATACQLYYYRREPQNMLRVLDGVSRDWLRSNAFDGPKAVWAGFAHELAGRPESARVQWEAALQQVEQRLTRQPDAVELLWWKALCLAHLDRRNEAGKLFQLAHESNARPPISTGGTGRAYESILLGREDEALTLLEDSEPLLTAAGLRLYPGFDPLRGSPRFQTLLARLEADPRSSPHATPIAASAAADDKSVAVLAFANLSDDKANEYFSDGVSEELLTVLQKIPGLRVSSRTSAFSFKGRDVSVQEIGRALGVGYLIEGSVRKSGGKVRVTARLSDTDSGRQLWSENYTRDVEDVFALQTELAQTIVGQLQDRLTGTADISDVDVVAQVTAAQKGGTKNVAAHELYLQGRYFANQPSLENLGKAVDLLQRAVDLDPGFALAWGALARNVAIQAEYLDTTPETLRECFARARRAADRAIALAPKLPDGYSARLEIQTAYDFDWQGANESLQTALALAPADALLISNASQLATQFGDFPRSLELGRRAAKLDPVNPEIRYWLGRTYLCAGLLAEGEAELRRAAELSPSVLSVHRQLALALVYQGRAVEAVAEAKLEKDEWSRQAALAVACWAAKDVSAADAALARLIEVGAEIAAYQVAEAYAFRGETDAAFQWLDRAYRNRDAGFGQLRVDPLLKSLHSDPRWAPFLRQARLADEQVKEIFLPSS